MKQTMKQALQKKMEVFAVKLFQDENALGPRLKPDEEYVHSWMTKEGRIISHDYRRNKISPDEPPLQPRLTIFGVRPPAGAEDYQDKSEIRNFPMSLQKLIWPMLDWIHLSRG